LASVIFAVGICQRQSSSTADLPASGTTGGDKTGGDETSDSELQPDSDSEPDADEAFRGLILGTWEDDYKGHRTFTVRDDGTATMVVELTGLSARLYAKKLTIDEEWSIENGRVHMKMVGGEPKSRVNLIMKAMGDSTDQEILELTAERMHLLDPNGKTKYDWRRVRP
jgi:hypothetical protein